MRLVAQLKWIGERPYIHDGVGHESDGRSLGDDKNAGIGFPGGQMCAEMLQHGPPVMRHQYAILTGCTVKFDASGWNSSAHPVVAQWKNGELHTIWPAADATVKPVLPPGY